MASTALVRRGAATGRAAVVLRHSSNWVFLVPTLIFFVGWQVYPIFRVLWMSFTDYHFLRNQPAQWVGLLNYVNAFADPLVLTGLLRALTFTALFLPGMIFVPMLLAILVDRVSHATLATTYRLILLIPAVIPGPLIFVLWKWLYNFNIGPIDYLLIQSGLVTPQTAPQWLGNASLTLPAIAIMEVWWGLGYHTMFYLAGLAAIPKELFEAARVDGANEWSLFRHITLPRLRPILLVLVVLRFGTAMAVIDEYLILGGFNRALPTYTWTVYMWDEAFQIGDWFQGYAAAIGWIGAAAMLMVVGALFWLFRNGIETQMTTSELAQVRTSAIPAPRPRGIKIGTVVRHVVLLGFMLVILLPLAWVLLLSIKSIPDAYRPGLWPENFDFTHYGYAINNIPTLARNMLNSVLVTTSTVVVTTICAVMGGYALVHLTLKGRAVVLALLVASLFFPTRVTSLIAIFEIQRALGLINTTVGLILPYVTLNLALSVFIMRGIFEQISHELVDAAKIDGAGAWRTLLFVLLPLTRNGIVVVIIVNFVSAWGEYLLGVTLTNDQEVRTLPVVLAGAFGGMGQWAWPRIAAVYVMAIAPGMAAFALTQRWYMRGLQEGALKY